MEGARPWRPLRSTNIPELVQPNQILDKKASEYYVSIAYYENIP